MTSMLYECFVAAVETLNFTLAAQKIHITQPAFSRNIASLEDELGFKLFWRSKQSGLHVTPAGLVMYNGMKKLQEDFVQLKHQASRISRGEEGKLVISILNGCCMDGPTFQVIQKFRERYPHIEVVLKSCTFAQLLSSLEEGWSDVAFSMQEVVLDHEHLMGSTVCVIHSYMVVPASLKCDKEKLYCLADFKDQVFLLSEDAPEINREFLLACKQAGFEPKTKVAPDYETKMLWAEMGQGLAANSIDHYMSKSSYVDFIKVEELHDMNYALVWEKNNYNPAIELFHELTAEIMSS